MLIEQPFLLALNIATLVVIIFSSNLLILRSFKQQTYLPLAICLLSIGIIICQPFLQLFGLQVRSIFLVLSLPALLLLAPSFWFYVSALTSENRWSYSNKLTPHLIPFSIGTLVAISALVLPAEIRYSLLVEGDDAILESSPVALRYLTYGLLISTFVLILGWIIQSGFYFLRIVRRLHAYREHLKDLFASTESKEIRWISWLLIAVGGVWMATAISLILDNLFTPVEFDPVISNLFTLVMIWSVALWGLRQKPGFEDLYDSDEELNKVLIQQETNFDSNNQQKYQRSALDQQQSSSIAGKIENAMQADKLYLDASLSLQKLAKHIHTSPNYISQTLNETLGSNFFDLVNKYRVEKARELLKTTENTVLDIAMEVGFNAKSSFYTAFKKETQQTPAQYRKLNQNLDFKSE